jgi:pyruvate ferredoxin oxidoreductase gamma subunit
MENLVEIRWHGRGGQGAKTAALLMGEAMLAAGKYIQAFPEYGPERTGAPVASYNRIAEAPIYTHCAVTDPEVVVVLDETLMDTVDVTAGLIEDGKIIINTQRTPAELRKQLELNGRHVYTVNASKISQDTIGRDIPNTPMLGAMAKVTGLLTLDHLLADTRARLEKKFRGRPQIIEGNVMAIERAYNEVTGEK